MALSVGTPRGVASRVYPAAGLLASAPAGYAASRPLVFGLSSSPELLRGKRFSALPKSRVNITAPRQADKLCQRQGSAGAAACELTGRPRPVVLQLLAAGRLRYTVSIAQEKKAGFAKILLARIPGGRV